jgi:hypothetical protein
VKDSRILEPADEVEGAAFNPRNPSVRITWSAHQSPKTGIHAAAFQILSGLR